MTTWTKPGLVRNPYMEARFSHKTIINDPDCAWAIPLLLKHGVTVARFDDLANSSVVYRIGDEPRGRLVAYLQRTGWVPPIAEGLVGGLWRHPKHDLLMPVPHELNYDGFDWFGLTERLSIIEGRPKVDIASEIAGEVSA